MSGPVVANLVRAGHTVTGYEVSRAKVDKFVAEGGRRAASIAASAAGAEIVITMLPADRPRCCRS